VSSPQPAQLPIRKKKAAPALTNTYQKAHKSYVLASALFASWVLIGFGLNTKDRWGLEIKSPNGIPLILLTMIFYFGYRLTVEWMQCDEERRSMRVAKVDFLIAHGIAVVALSIGVIQYLSHIRIADYVSTANTRPALFIFALLEAVSLLGAIGMAAWVAGRQHTIGVVEILTFPPVVTLISLFAVGVLLSWFPINMWVALSYSIVWFVAMSSAMYRLRLENL
jgi:hypothetical protein